MKINEKLSREGKFSFFFISLMSWHIAEVYYAFKNFSIPMTQTLLADISLQTYFTKLLSKFQFKEYQWNLTHNLVLFESTFLYIRKVIAYITILVFISGIVFVFLLIFFFFSSWFSVPISVFTTLNPSFFFFPFKQKIRKVDVERMTDGTEIILQYGKENLKTDRLLNTVIKYLKWKNTQQLQMLFSVVRFFQRNIVWLLDVRSQLNVKI